VIFIFGSLKKTRQNIPKRTNIDPKDIHVIDKGNIVINRELINNNIPKIREGKIKGTPSFRMDIQNLSLMLY
jgi:hypothetical protein